MGASIRDCGGVEMSGGVAIIGLRRVGSASDGRSMGCVAGRMSLVRLLCWRAMMRRYRLRAGRGQ